MERIALFCLPKAFVGHFGMIQKNAIASWRVLLPNSDIFLMGEEEGCAEVAREFGVRHLAAVKCNEFGTPLLNDAFRLVAENAEADWLCYLNADIILTDDLLVAMTLIQKRIGQALVVGRRWNVDIVEAIAFEASRKWQRRFRDRVRETGELYDGWNIDYFIFRKGLVVRMPAFAVGRPAWDNWMIYEARRCRMAVVDATKAVMAIHQNHDYSHTREGLEGGKQALWFGVEAERNRKLAGHHLFSIVDATHFFCCGRFILPNVSPKRMIRHARVAADLYPEWRARLRLLFALEVLLNRIDRRVRIFLLHRGIDLFPHKEKRIRR